MKRSRELSNQQEEALLAGYQEMAADQAREVEAQEWIEGLMSMPAPFSRSGTVEGIRDGEPGRGEGA